MVRRRVGISLLAFSPHTLAGQGTYTIGVTRALVSRGMHDYVLFVPPRYEDAWRRGLPSEAAIVISGPNPDHRFRRVFFEQRRLPALARRARVDTLFFPHFIAPTWRLPRAVVTVHDLLLLSEATDFSWYKRVYHRWSYGRLRSGVGRIVTVSEFSRRDIITRLGVSADRVSVASPGLDPEFMDGFLQNHASPPVLPDRYLLSVAGVYPHKRLDVSLKAFAAVAAGEPDLHLVLAGTHIGWPDAILRLRAEAATALAARIHFLPRMPREQLPVVFRRAAALVSASAFEGFGIPIIEAMAVGCPVAASPAEAVVEVLGGCGWVAADFTAKTLAAAICQAVAGRTCDPDRLARGQARAARCYTWDASASVLESVLADGDW